MKKSKIVLSLLVVFVMLASLFALIACTEKPQPEVELVMWAPAGAQTFYQTWADKWAEEYSKSEAAQGKTYKVIMGIMGEKDAATNLAIPKARLLRQGEKTAICTRFLCRRTTLSICFTIRPFYMRKT